VALGDSGVQSVPFGQSDGSYRVESSAGSITITHVNWDGAGSEETIVNQQKLGAVVYENSDTEVAYQGGGVWRKDSAGVARMISPPEFHYRQGALTLPVIEVRGSDSASGSITGRVSREDGWFTQKFPNGETYDDTSQSYANPIEKGYITITVKSEYCEGWKTYFQERTSGEIDSDACSDGKVTLTLNTLNEIEEFDPVPNEGNGLNPQGMKTGHDVTRFDLTLAEDDSGGSKNDFQNMHWSLFFEDDSSSTQFELHLRSDGQCNGNPETFNGDIYASIYYYDDVTDKSEEWESGAVDPTDPNSAFQIDCDTGELYIDFLSDTELTYGDLTSVPGSSGHDAKWYFGSDINDNSVPSTSVTFDRHDNEGNYQVGKSKQLSFLVNHYLSLLAPNFKLVVKDGPGSSSRIDEENSEGYLGYDTKDTGYITYLHISENEIEVEFS
jgi:hypothetical protein